MPAQAGIQSRYLRALTHGPGPPLARGERRRKCPLLVACRCQRESVIRSCPRKRASRVGISAPSRTALDPRLRGVSGGGSARFLLPAGVSVSLSSAHARASGHPESVSPRPHARPWTPACAGVIGGGSARFLLPAGVSVSLSSAHARASGHPESVSQRSHAPLWTPA